MSVYRLSSQTRMKYRQRPTTTSGDQDLAAELEQREREHLKVMLPLIMGLSPPVRLFFFDITRTL